MMTIAILLVVLGELGALGAVYRLGYTQRETKELLDELRTEVKKRISPEPKPAPPTSPGSVVIDPDDPVQRANYIRDQLNQGKTPEEEE